MLIFKVGYVFNFYVNLYLFCSEYFDLPEG